MLLLKDLGIIENIEIYILLFFTYSFAGWFMESVGGILNVKKFVNRGFLIGPYCPVYGYGVVFITILLNKIKTNLILLFLLSILICGTLEYLTSYFMEKLFNARWWDYHNKRFNLNGRICLETVIPFGLAGTIIIYFFNPYFINTYSNIPNVPRLIISLTLFLIYVVDTIISFKIIRSFKGEIYEKKDNTEEISEKVKDKTEEIGERVRDRTEEISEKVKDKTEDMIMKTESNIIVFGRRLKLGRLKFGRRITYTRKQLANSIIYTPKELAERINHEKELFNEKLAQSRERLENQIKINKEEFEKKQRETKELFDNEIRLAKNEMIQKINSFKEKSFLRKRLIDAFPSLQVIPREKKRIKANNKK